MAKGKNLNPADAFRKAQRKKELKKNKTERSKNRDFALVKKDTQELEQDIEKLEAASEPSASDKTRLKELQTELEKINKKKEEWVAEHPEHRKLVFRSRRQADKDEKPDEAPELKTRKLFDRHGIPRHPERSIYYDPVMNPFGVPPPGMPYVERLLRPDEVASDDDDDDEDDIVMPMGPPPGADEEEDSDDDIPMPEGPPPSKDGTSQAILLPPMASGSTVPPPSFPPPGLSPLPPPPVFSGLPPPPPPGFSSAMPPAPRMLPAHPAPGFPPMPSGFAMPPPPPPGFPPNHMPAPPEFFAQLPPPGFLPNFFPPPPPGFFPRRSQSSSASQDPLSSVPHQTYQAHRAQKLATALSSDNPRPNTPTSGGVALSKPAAAAATISAAPELRDFKKESTAFVPAALKRKRPAAGVTSKVNAAPSLEPVGSEEPEAGPVRPDLMSTLKDKFGPAVGTTGTADLEPKAKKAKPQPKDDYAKFMEEMGDILGST